MFLYIKSFLFFIIYNKKTLIYKILNRINFLNYISYEKLKKKKKKKRKVELFFLNYNI